MKKIAISTVAFLLAVGAANAQTYGKATRTTAYMALDNYKKEKDPALLAKAKDNIDKASSDQSSVKDETVTWLYKGNIYKEVAIKEFSDQLATIKDVTDPGKKQMMAYGMVNPGSVMEAATSYLTAFKMDTKQIYPDDIRAGARDVNTSLQYIGVSNFNQKKYAEALPAFEKALELLTIFGNKVDTGLYVNTANSALNAKNNEKAVQYLTKLTEIKYGKGHTYFQLSTVYHDMGNDAKAKETTDKGLALYPTDPDLLVGVVNGLIKENKMSEAVDKLNAIIAARPNDADLRVVVGQVYAVMANPQDAASKMLEKPKNYEELVAKAEEQFKKSIELKPNTFDNQFELGKLYYNQGIEYYNRSNSTTLADAAKYKTMYEAPLKSSVQYMEKALELSPKDHDTMGVLKACYGLLGDTDKYNAMKERLKNN